MGEVVEIEGACGALLFDLFGRSFSKKRSRAKEENSSILWIDHPRAHAQHSLEDQDSKESPSFVPLPTLFSF